MVARELTLESCPLTSTRAPWQCVPEHTQITNKGMLHMTTKPAAFNDATPTVLVESVLAGSVLACFLTAFPFPVAGGYHVPSKLSPPTSKASLQDLPISYPPAPVISAFPV